MVVIGDPNKPVTTKTNKPPSTPPKAPPSSLVTKAKAAKPTQPTIAGSQDDDANATKPKPPMKSGGSAGDDLMNQLSASTKKLVPGSVVTKKKVSPSHKLTTSSPQSVNLTLFNTTNAHPLTFFKPPMAGHKMQLIEVAALPKKVAKTSYEQKPLSADAIHKAKMKEMFLRPNDSQTPPTSPPSLSPPSSPPANSPSSPSPAHPPPPFLTDPSSSPSPSLSTPTPAVPVHRSTIDSSGANYSNLSDDGHSTFEIAAMVSE